MRTQSCRDFRPEMRSVRWSRYGTAVTLVDPAAARAADAQQAAYFRASLCDERSELLSEIMKRREDVARRSQHGSTHAVHRLRSQLRSAESQLRYVDRLIAGLDHRFGGRA